MKTKLAALFLLILILLSLFAASGVGAQGPTPTPPAGPSNIAGEQPNTGLINGAADVFVGITTWLIKKTGREVTDPHELPTEITIFNLWRISLWPNFLTDSILNRFISASSIALLALCPVVLLGYLIWSLIRMVYARQLLNPTEKLGFVIALMVIAIFAAAQAELLTASSVIAVKISDNIAEVLTPQAGASLLERLSAVYDFFSEGGPTTFLKTSGLTSVLFSLLIYEYSLFSLALRFVGVFGLWYALFALLITQDYRSSVSVLLTFFTLWGILTAFSVGLQTLSAYLTTPEFIRNLDSYLPGALILLMVGPPLAALGLWMSWIFARRGKSKLTHMAKVDT